MEASPSLTELLATVPDPRSRFGRRYALPCLLTLMATALLAVRRSPSSPGTTAPPDPRPRVHVRQNPLQGHPLEPPVSAPPTEN